MQERPLSSAYDPDTRTLAFSGTVDETSLDVFRADIAAAGTPVVIDLSDVDYFPSVAIAALVGATRSDDGSASSELLAAEGTVAQRVLRICGLPHRTS